MALSGSPGEIQGRSRRPRQRSPSIRINSVLRVIPAAYPGTGAARLAAEQAQLQRWRKRRRPPALEQRQPPSPPAESSRRTPTVTPSTDRSDTRRARTLADNVAFSRPAATPAAIPHQHSASTPRWRRASGRGASARAFRRSAVDLPAPVAAVPQAPPTAPASPQVGAHPFACATGRHSAHQRLAAIDCSKAPSSTLS